MCFADYLICNLTFTCPKQVDWYLPRHLRCAPYYCYEIYLWTPLLGCRQWLLKGLHISNKNAQSKNALTTIVGDIGTTTNEIVFNIKIFNYFIIPH